MGNQFEKTPQKTSVSVKQLYKTYRQSFKVTQKKYPNLKIKKLPIQNKDQLIDSLFQSFHYVRKYSWAKQLYPLFRLHFYQGFQKIWLGNRQQFYQNLALMSQQTGMMNSQIREQVKKKITFQKYFYEEGPGKRKSANSIIDRQLKLMQSIKVINSSILQDGGDCFPECSRLSFTHNGIQLQPAKKFESEYYPSKVYEESQNCEMRKNNKSQLKFNREKVQKSSIIIPQTVFLDRLDEQEKNQITEFVSFYRVFSNSIQQVIYSNSLVSCPLKHFQISIKEKLNRKKISKNSKSNNRVLFDTKQSKNIRMKRHHNNNLLLFEVRDFTQAYSQFIWKYLNLQRLQETYIGTLVTIGTVYNIVLKSVWSVCGWIGMRGYEWQQSKLPQIVSRIEIKEAPVSIRLIEQGQELSKQTNPIHYFKQIVLLYRQTSRVCPNADKLLDSLQRIMVEVVKRGRHTGFLRMHNIIEKLIKMDETNGQISYAWTSWCILIEMLKSKLEELVAEKALQSEYLIIDN